LTVPSYFAEKSVIIGGQLKENQYCDYKKEMQMILQAFCEVMLEVMEREDLLHFPIPTINLTKEFDFDNKAYDPLWELTANMGLHISAILSTHL
jgi:ribonucleoside-triphosphate reductase